MLQRIGGVAPRRIVRGAAQTAFGGAVVGAAGLVAYTSTERGRGVRRELQFWSKVAPVAFHYYWHFADSSPYVKYNWYRFGPDCDDGEEQRNDEHKTDEEQLRTAARKRKRAEKLKRLHQQHAPEILEVLLVLKGLYVKLGQVLSVTALPVPEAYREQFRTLQSDVPGWEAFEDAVRPVLERELRHVPDALQEILDTIDPIPCGAASIGQAHKAKLDGDDVIVKVQYPDAAWQIPADIQCVGDLLKLCVFFGVVDESAANLSYDEFSRQFLAELDYDQEKRNLQEIYESTLDPEAPYERRGVVVPKVFPEACTGKVIVMSYLPGPKLEEEARRQLEALGFDTKGGLRSLVRGVAEKTQRTTSKEIIEAEDIDDDSPNLPLARKATFAETPATKILNFVKGFVSVDSLLGVVRFARRAQLWCTAATVKVINVVSEVPVTGMFVPSSVLGWAEVHRTAAQQAKRLSWTREWIDALFDTHGHQVFNLGCFNADAHPGNILVLEQDETSSERPKLGLIDFGQCKRLTRDEQVQIGRLIVSVANRESDDAIADAFRGLGIRTKNDSSVFLAQFARLMFGRLESYHLNPSWHRELRKEDVVTYFPNQLSMVYRTSMLLRGLAISLQVNVSVGDLWKSHAQAAIERMDSTASASIEQGMTRAEDETAALVGPKGRRVIIRRMTTKEVIDDLREHAV